MASFAGTGFGVGISYVFGSGVAVGAKVFSDDEKSETAASLGIDYIITSGGWRPSVGATYLGNNNYGDFNAGYNLTTGTFDFGVGGGYSDTDDSASASASASTSIKCPAGSTSEKGKCGPVAPH